MVLQNWFKKKELQPDPPATTKPAPPAKQQSEAAPASPPLLPALLLWSAHLVHRHGVVGASAGALPHGGRPEEVDGFCVGPARLSGIHPAAVAALNHDCSAERAG